MTQALLTKAMARVNQICSGDGSFELRHTDGTKEALIMGKSNGCVFIYDEEPNLIRAFEYEGYGAERENVKLAAMWLCCRAAA